MIKADKIIKFIVSIVICQLAGIIGSFFTANSIPTWYLGLAKPSFNPPNWVFAPVWTTLFILMGVSLYLIWEEGFKSEGVKTGLLLFGVQLILNILWSIIFFGLRNPFIAFIEIVVLWIAILLTILKFYKVSRTAAYLLIPYILWVTFAAILNLIIFILN
ncbi:TspO protein [Euryarchaeota archaeon SM23-78]|nr:MAG: TspO protein [Euryarchaeota archaeon SM23-78]MBW3000540.1 tryptophan-rich sensory protein [Candidatus Woesearchaeota archaeon]